jgi:hypothetical protein
VTRRLIAGAITLLLVVLGFAPKAISQVPGSSPTATTTPTSSYDTSAHTSEVTFVRESIGASGKTPPAPTAVARGELLVAPAVFVAADTAATGSRSVDEVLNSLPKGKQELS